MNSKKRNRVIALGLAAAQFVPLTAVVTTVSAFAANVTYNSVVRTFPAGYENESDKGYQACKLITDHVTAGLDTDQNVVLTFDKTKAQIEAIVESSEELKNGAGKDGGVDPIYLKIQTDIANDVTAGDTTAEANKFVFTNGYGWDEADNHEYNFKDSCIMLWLKATATGNQSTIKYKVGADGDEQTLTIKYAYAHNVTKAAGLIGGEIGDIKVGTENVTEDKPAKVGDTVTVNVTPSSGYTVEKVTYKGTADGATETEATSANGAYTFIMPDDDVTVSATFKQIDYTISAENGSDYTIDVKKFDDSSLDANTAVHVGDKLKVTVTYKGDKTVTGVELGDTTLNKDTTNDKVYATTEYEVQAPADGTIITLTPTFTFEGEQQPDEGTITLTPQSGTGYTVAIKNTDGTELEANKKFNDGDSVKVIIIPSDNANNPIKSVTLAGVTSFEKNETDGSYSGTYTVSAPKDGSTEITINPVVTFENGAAVDETVNVTIGSNTGTGTGTVKVSYEENGETKELTENGTVKKGTVLTITATTESGNKLTSLKINGTDRESGQTFIADTAVNIVAVFDKDNGETPAETEVPVTITQPASGKITVTKDGTAVDKVKKGDILTITVTDYDESKYETPVIKVNGTAISGSYTVKDEKSIAVTAELTEKKTDTPATDVAVKINQTGNGTVEVKKDGTAVTGKVATGSEITITAKPDTGYELDGTLKVEGATPVTGKADTYKVNGAVTITVNFKKTATPVNPEDNKVAVTFAKPEHGTVTVKSGDTELKSGDKVEKGAEITVAATPASGYELDGAVSVTGATAVEGKANTYTVTGAVTVTAKFKAVLRPTPGGSSSSGGSSSGGSSSGGSSFGGSSSGGSSSGGSSSGGSSSGGSYSGGSGSSGTTTSTSPSVDGKTVTTTQMNNEIKSSKETTVEVDVSSRAVSTDTETTATVRASTTKAITDTVNNGGANKAVEVKVTDDVTLTVDKKTAATVDSSKPIEIAVQKTPDAPGRKAEDNSRVRGTATKSFTASNVGSVEASISVGSSKNGQFANIYKINKDGKSEFVGTAKIENGKAKVNFKGDGKYVVMTGAYSDLKGDADNDGKINAKDAAEILKQIANVKNAANSDKSILDFNKDGKVNSKDAVWLLRHIAGM